ncbi:invasion associated locus B family protein [Belnapia sp. T6]|uniref:Invasion associated locus B family protein n=1 Tax=Belnapia mucosa TaxID=2804532 RepID=A0ABS1VBC0_9PROT|nr:invasion associated locus B family protein [Belnapia mucosa]MBL6457643.1 invasion associated locus B family protein [Belnapia mucosa]
MAWVAALSPLAVLAQQAPRAAAQPTQAPAPTPAPESPERTAAVFADWVMRCETRPANGTNPAARLCEMAQTTQDQRQQPVAVLAIGRVAKGEPLRLVAQVPVNVQVGQPARMVLDTPARQEPALTLPFRSCNPRGCFAEFDLRDEAVLRRLRSRAADAPARLEWRDATGAEAAIPVSFRGFSAAYDALAKEPE